METNKFNTLNDILLQQIFPGDGSVAPLQQCQLITQMYAKVENAISVLSDLEADKCYIYPGNIAHDFEIPPEPHVLDTIWEDEVFDRVLHEDLQEKHSIELQFFDLLKKTPVEERTNFKYNILMRMRNRDGEYVEMQHRVHYLYSADNGSILMAMGLYNYPAEKPENSDYKGRIINMRTGEIILPDRQQLENLLSAREKEILHLIKHGKSSKEIAGILSISINTVNRHRQNILEKLHVSNSIAACRIADSIKLI